MNRQQVIALALLLSIIAFLVGGRVAESFAFTPVRYVSTVELSSVYTGSQEPKRTEMRAIARGDNLFLLIRPLCKDTIFPNREAAFTWVTSMARHYARSIRVDSTSSSSSFNSNGEVVHDYVKFTLTKETK